MEQFIVEDLEVIFDDHKGKKSKTGREYTALISSLDNYYEYNTKIVKWNGGEYVESKPYFWRDTSRGKRIRVVTLSRVKKTKEEIIIVESW
jgi:hypothetical protein